LFSKKEGDPSVTQQPALDYFRTRRLHFEAGWRSPLTGGRCGWHRHAGIEIVCHLRGRGVTEVENGERTAFSPRSIEVYAPRVAHDQYNDGTGEDLCVLASSPTRRVPWLKGALRIPSSASADVMEDLFWLSSLPPDPDPLLQLAGDHCVSALMLRFLSIGTPRDRPTRSEPTYAQRARAYIREHFAGINRMRDVADHVGISYDYLRHVFKRECGMGLNEFLAKVRIERAKSLLMHSRLPIKTIASQCGFETDRYFSTCFRRAVGTPPGRFRRRGAVK
jgi:AraC-like DNA-binding protein